MMHYHLGMLKGHPVVELGHAAGFLVLLTAY